MMICRPSSRPGSSRSSVCPESFGSRFIYNNDQNAPPLAVLDGRRARVLRRLFVAVVLPAGPALGAVAALVALDEGPPGRALAAAERRGAEPLVLVHRHLLAAALAVRLRARPAAAAVAGVVAAHLGPAGRALAAAEGRRAVPLVPHRVTGRARLVARVELVHLRDVLGRERHAVPDHVLHRRVDRLDRVLAVFRKRAAPVVQNVI